MPYRGIERIMTTAYNINANGYMQQVMCNIFIKANEI